MNRLDETVGHGICVARAPFADEGISQGETAEFRLQFGPGGGRRGRGQVTVYFADGHKEWVEGVELPMPESRADRYVSLVGLGVIFAVGVAIHTVRSRKKHRSLPPSSDQT